MIKNLNDTISMQELALDTIPTPDQLLSDAMNTAPTPSTVAPAPSPPANNGGMTEAEQWEAILKEQGINGGGGGGLGSMYNPNDEGALSAHGE